jgi:proton-coupled amino acid transporter
VFYHTSLSDRRFRQLSLSISTRKASLSKRYAMSFLVRHFLNYFQVQFLYSLAILLSVPLQLFPAVRIMENGLFTQSGKADTRVKWQKNIFRFFVVMTCTFISWAGAADLDKFVAFVGSFAWSVDRFLHNCLLDIHKVAWNSVPLCLVYPAMLHYKACAHTRKQKIADLGLMAFGFVAAIFTTVQTIRVSFRLVWIS